MAGLKGTPTMLDWAIAMMAFPRPRNFNYKL